MMIHPKTGFDQLEALIRHAYAHAPAVRSKMDRAGVKPEEIRSFEDLARIPVTGKAEHIRLQAEAPPDGGFLIVPLNRLGRIALHPGPLYDWHTARAYEAARAFTGSVGFTAGDIVAVTFDYHLMGAGAVFDRALGDLGATVIPFGPGNRDLLIRSMRDLGVSGFVGTLGFLYALIQHAESAGFDFSRDFSLRRALVGAERVSPALRAELESRYGIETRQGYGTSEVSVVAWECGEKNGMHLGEQSIIEIIDPETGKPCGPDQIGEVVITPLDFERPLLRFGTGDLAAFSAEPCPCGDRSPRLIQIAGRLGEAHKVRGRFIHQTELDTLIGGFPEIRDCQMILAQKEHSDFVTLRVLPNPALCDPEDLRKRIIKKVKEKLGIRVDEVFFSDPDGEFEGEPHIVDRRSWD